VINSDLHPISHRCRLLAKFGFSAGGSTL